MICGTGTKVSSVPFVCDKHGTQEGQVEGTVVLILFFETEHTCRHMLGRGDRRRACKQGPPREKMCWEYCNFIFFYCRPRAFAVRARCKRGGEDEPRRACRTGRGGRDDRASRAREASGLLCRHWWKLEHNRALAYMFTKPKVAFSFLWQYLRAELSPRALRLGHDGLKLWDPTATVPRGTRIAFEASLARVPADLLGAAN